MALMAPLVTGDMRCRFFLHSAFCLFMSQVNESQASGDLRTSLVASEPIRAMFLKKRNSPIVSTKETGVFDLFDDV